MEKYGADYNTIEPSQEQLEKIKKLQQEKGIKPRQEKGTKPRDETSPKTFQEAADLIDFLTEI